MLKRILIIALVILIFIGGWKLYTRISQRAALGSGDVFSNDSSSPKDSSDGTTDLDGHPMTKVGPTPSRSDAPGTINGEAVSDSTTNRPPAAMKTSTAAAPIAADSAAGPVPVRDTISPNAPNGMAFGGTGKFQWYRQGNLTWRIDTASGSSCIAFATMEEWRKAIVISHGCGNS